MFNQKNKYPVLFAIMVLLFALPAAAAELEKDIAVVNIQKIMKEAKVAESARNQLQSKQKQFQEDISKQETALQKEDQELAKQRTILSQEAFKKRVDEFRKKAAGAQKDVREKRASLSRAYDKAIADIQKQVLDIIAEMAKERGFQMAVPASQILYSTDALDISGEVLERLNKKMPSIKVQF